MKIVYCSVDLYLRGMVSPPVVDVQVVKLEQRSIYLISDALCDARDRRRVFSAAGVVVVAGPGAVVVGAVAGVTVAAVVV